jgi:hypothetical protein
MPEGIPYQGGPDNQGFANFGEWWKAVRGPTGVPPSPVDPGPAGGMDLVGDEMPIQGGITPTWQPPSVTEGIQGDLADEIGPATAAPRATAPTAPSTLANVVPPRKPFYIDESVDPLSAIANLQSPPPAPREDPLSAIAGMETPETSALLQWLMDALSAKPATPDGSTPGASAPGAGSPF